LNCNFVFTKEPLPGRKVQRGTDFGVWKKKRRRGESKNAKREKEAAVVKIWLG
jgi:hypothetical protein